MSLVTQAGTALTKDQCQEGCEKYDYNEAAQCILKVENCDSNELQTCIDSISTGLTENE